MSGRLLALEIRRALRSSRYVMFVLAFPAGFFLLFSELYGDGTVQGTTAHAYLMISMGIFGALGSTLSIGGRIVLDRQIGWNRLLRLTPLRSYGYLAARLAAGLALAVPSVLLVFATGYLLEDVRLSGTQWAAVAGYFLPAALPFAVLGIALGYLATVDSAPAITGASQMVLSLFGGVWIPVSQMPHAMVTIGKALPSFWFGVVVRSPLTHEHLAGQGVAVLAAWTVGTALLAAWRYRLGQTRA